MIRSDPIYWARWLFIPTGLILLLIIVPCSLSFIKHEYFLSAFHFWANSNFWIPCLGGLICGVLWMGIVVGLAPSHKCLAGFISYFPGAWLAWCLIGESNFYPGESMVFGVPTHLPVYFTWWAGLFGLAIMWFLSRRGSAKGIQPVPRRRAIGYSVLGASVVLFCGFVVPSAVLFAKWSLYEGALKAMSDNREALALCRVQRIARIPGFDLEWTPGDILSPIPSGYELDMKMFGCPSCRGIHRPLLQVAAGHGQAEVVEWMVHRRGSVEYDGDGGLSLLDAAIGSKSVPVVRFLLENGADPAATNVMGGVMHCAVMVKAPRAILETLLSAGAPVNDANPRGFTPLDFAHIWEPDVIPFLRDHGATNGLVKVGLILVNEAERVFMFEGTDFGIQLPAGFLPWNRLQTPSDHQAWEVRNEAGSSLMFVVGKAISVKGPQTSFKGFPAIISRRENNYSFGWSAEASIAFDSSGKGHQEETPRYDAKLIYDAKSPKDQRALENALETFFKKRE